MCSAVTTPAGGASIQDRSSRTRSSRCSASLGRCEGSEFRTTTVYSLLVPADSPQHIFAMDTPELSRGPVAWSLSPAVSTKQSAYVRAATAGPIPLWSSNSADCLRPQFGVH